MRVRFAQDDASSVAALVERAGPFFESLGMLSPGAEHDLVSKLRRVSPHLACELLPGPTLHVFALEPHYRPLLEALLARAPVLPHLKVVGKEPTGDLHWALERTAPRTARALSEAQARVGFTRGHLLQIVLGVPWLGGFEHEELSAAAERLVRDLVGGERVDDWVELIEVVPKLRPGLLRVLDSGAADELSLPLDELAPTVAAAIDALSHSLPERPRFELPADDEWTMLEGLPSVAADYAAQDDLLIATTCLPELLKCFLVGSPFCSRRFSQCGELFAFIKWQSRMDSMQDRLAERQRVEDELDAVLRAGRRGSVFGNGLGVRYSYVDVALLDPPAIELIQNVSRTLSLPERAWLLFLDESLKDEWVNLSQGRPAPPGMLWDLDS